MNLTLGSWIDRLCCEDGGTFEEGDEKSTKGRGSVFRWNASPAFSTQIMVQTPGIAVALVSLFAACSNAQAWDYTLFESSPEVAYRMSSAPVDRSAPANKT